MQNMAIEPMPVAKLRPYAQNARTHSKKQIRQIATSIERFGFTNPVLISDDNEIIAGHGRVEAAKLLSIKEVPRESDCFARDARRKQKLTWLMSAQYCRNTWGGWCGCEPLE